MNSSKFAASGVLAAGGAVTSVIGTAPDRDVYYLGTEELKIDEIRLIACGTGLPTVRRDQAATCFLVEAGNGNTFLFYIATGSSNVAALMIPYRFLDKVFLAHLHTDHWGIWLLYGAGAGLPDVSVRWESGVLSVKSRTMEQHTPLTAS